MTDVKPKVDQPAGGGKPDALAIKVLGQDGESIDFKVKPTTKLVKVRFAQVCGVTRAHWVCRNMLRVVSFMKPLRAPAVFHVCPAKSQAS